MKQKLTLTVLMFVSLLTLAQAQGGQVLGQALFGGGIPNATVRVCQWSATPSTPCTPMVSIYSTPALDAPHLLSNPTNADVLGNYSFFAQPGLVNIQLSGPNSATTTLTAMVHVAPTAPGNLINPTLLGSGWDPTASSICLQGNVGVQQWATCPGGGGGGGAVTSVFGRTGIVVSAANDYSFSQISGTIATGQLPWTVTGSTTNLVTYSGSFGANGVIPCSDGSNLKFTGCSTAGVNVGTSPGAGVTQTVNQSGAPLNVTIFEQVIYSDNYAPSSSGGVNEAAAHCITPSACRVVVPVGTWAACNVGVPPGVYVEGQTRTGSVLACATANAPTVSSIGTGGALRNIKVIHTVLPTCATPTTCGDGVSTGTGQDRIRIENVQSTQNWNAFRLGKVTYAEMWGSIGEYIEGDAVLFDPTLGTSQGTMQWMIHGGLFEQGGGWCFDINDTTQLMTLPTLADAFQCYGMQSGGVRYKTDSLAHRLDDAAIGGDSVISTNNGPGVLLDTFGRNHDIKDDLIELSGQYVGTWGYGLGHTVSVAPGVGPGVQITSNCDPTGPVMIHAIKFWENSYAGVDDGCAGTMITHNSFFDNGFAATGTASQRAGVAIKASQAQASANWFGSGQSQQLYGFDISNGADYPALINNVLGPSGAPSAQANFVHTTTAPAHGFQMQINNIWDITNVGAPTGSCPAVGSRYTRTDALGFYICNTGLTWSPVTIP